MSSRIRIGMIGLSTTSKSTNWGGRAHLPYLQSPQGQKYYEIVALCNSSKASGEKTIKEYNLSPSVKVYDNPSELANDSDVDLIVNVTDVAKHHELCLPAVQAGKNVYTELPLAANMSQIKELVEAAQSKKVKTVFGAQGQTSPVTALIKKTIAEGKIGKVLSSTWVSAGGHLGEKPLPLNFIVFGQRDHGANLMTVSFLHTFNHILSALGELDSYTSVLGNQRPTLNLFDPEKGPSEIVKSIQKDTPEHILLQGRLKSGAIVTYHLRGGDPFPGQPGVVWTIYGEKGEIRITNPMSMIDIVHAGVKIELHVFGEEKAQELSLPEDELSDLPHPAQNVGRIYHAYAEGKAGGEDGYPDWDLALTRHVLMQEMFDKAIQEGVL